MNRFNHLLRLVDYRPDCAMALVHESLFDTSLEQFETGRIKAPRVHDDDRADVKLKRIPLKLI